MTSSYQDIPTVPQVEIVTVTDCPNVNGASAIKASQGMTCGEARDIALGWSRVCGDPTKDCPYDRDGVTCASNPRGLAGVIKCAEGERLTKFVVPPTFGRYPVHPDS